MTTRTTLAPTTGLGGDRSDRAPRGTERRTSARRPAQHAPELAGLALDDLRVYRQELITEESRVSYWRRILHARMDLVALETRTVARLREVLTDHQSDSRRLSLTALGGSESAPPPLPNLAVLWETLDTAESADSDVLARLASAEHELSAYRRALHERLDAATGELIMRYREEPSLALRALPLRRGA